MFWQIAQWDYNNGPSFFTEPCISSFYDICQNTGSYSFSHFYVRVMQLYYRKIFAFL